MPGNPPSGAAAGAACSRCGDTGFLVEVVDGRGTARPCVCRGELRRRSRIEHAQIPPRYRHCTLASFEPHRPPLQQALRFAMRVVEEFPSDRGLVFQGPCGTGKTHLATAVLRELLETRGATGLFAEFTYLLRRIQDTYDRRSQTPSWAVLQPALEAQVLVLDDLGCTRMTPWVQETLGLILNERYNHRRLTLITTNLADNAAAGEESLADRIGERLRSRLAEMCLIVPVDGEDYRRSIRSASFHLR